MQGDAAAAFANAAARIRSESPTPDWTISDMSSGIKLTPCERGWDVRLVMHGDRCSRLRGLQTDPNHSPKGGEMYRKGGKEAVCRR